MLESTGERELCFTFRNIAESTVSLVRKYFDEENYAEVVSVGVSGDVTRRIDLVAENHIINRVKELDIDAWILSEERGLWKAVDRPQYIVLVDPLDGSLNYAHRIPFASISIAVFKGPKSIVEPEYGVVYNIFTRDIIELCGGSIYFNGSIVDKYLNRGAELASIYTENPLHLDIIARAINSSGLKLKVRTMGSASIEAAYAAIGLIGHFIHLTGKLRNTDIPVALAIANRLGTNTHVDPPIHNIRLDAIQNIRKVLISYRGSPLVKLWDAL